MNTLSLAWLVPLGIAGMVWTAVAILHGRFWTSLVRLSSQPLDMPGGKPWPRVSVLVPSCNEEQAVEAGTRSLLAQDFPALQVVAIDDRSKDRTGVILDGLKQDNPGLHVVHIQTLPPGWLGKNHANHVGASQASGEWLLFTDGDVLFAPDVLRRAVAYAERHGLDHLTALPHLIAPGFWERAAQSASFALILAHFKTWELQQPRTDGYVGVGAFNLVRRSAYDAVDGHQKLAMEVVDDMKLGMILRRSGFRQGMVDPGESVRVRWQAGFINSFRGLLKNSFAVANYGWGLVILTQVAVAFLTLFPLVAMALGPDLLVRGLALSVTLVSMAVHGFCARRVAGGSGLEGITHPLMACMLAGTIFLAAWLATTRRGISWRGTTYSLDALRAGCVREKDWPIDKVVGFDPG